jgi:hypothetical protein
MLAQGSSSSLPSQGQGIVQHLANMYNMYIWWHRAWRTVPGRPEREARWRVRPCHDLAWLHASQAPQHRHVLAASAQVLAAVAVHGGTDDGPEIT